LGDLMKQRYRGWRAVILAGDADRGKHVGLKPSLRLPVRNGPLDARILVFDLY
jgi:putative N6-adenine-specific DNA methylase